MSFSDDSSSLRRKDVQRRFDRAAANFDTADFVHSVTRDGLFARLEPVVIEAKTVVDLGSATGSGSRLLARRFRRARVVAIDLAHEMLVEARKKQSWFSRNALVQATAEAMPFADHSVDVVFANLLLPWFSEPTPIFSEIARVLRKDGLFVFATLGPDSLSELRRAWRTVDDGQHVNSFLDMHDLGDVAVRCGLRDPVLDVDHLTVTYADHGALFQDLTAMGARNCLRGRKHSLSGRAQFMAMTDALGGATRDGLLSFELELVYGHCWAAGARPDAGEYRVAASEISRRGAAT